MHAARSILVILVAALAGCATPVPDVPTCPADATVAQAVSRYAAMQPEPNPPTELSAAGAACGQAKFARALAPTHGRVVGWKAGLTNPVMQKRFGVDEPVRGTLLEKMLLRDGAEVPAKFGVRPDAAFAEALRSMTVRVVDGAGRELDAARGEVILGHPLNAVMWLAADLKRAGITLRPGDLLSLGSFSKGLPTQPGASARVVYEGLPGNPSVSVRFR
jgi:2-keto-4-pentenoate hydratase